MNPIGLFKTTYLGFKTSIIEDTIYFESSYISSKLQVTSFSLTHLHLDLSWDWSWFGNTGEKLLKQCLMAKACVQVFGMEDVHLHSHHHWRLHSRESTQTNLFFSKTQINFPGINLNTSASKCRNGRQTSLFTHVVITSVVGRTYKCQIAN